MVVRRPLVHIDGEMAELPSGDTLPGSGGSLVWSSATVTVPGPKGQFEHVETVIDAAVVPSSVIMMKLAPVTHDDENSPEMVVVEEMVATPGTGQFEVLLTFNELHSGPIKVQYQVS